MPAHISGFSRSLCIAISSPMARFVLRYSRRLTGFDGVGAGTSSSEEMSMILAALVLTDVEDSRFISSSESARETKVDNAVLGTSSPSAAGEKGGAVRLVDCMSI